MLTNKKNITTHIPHRFPIIMIDDLVEQKENYTITNFKIEADNIFVRDGEFQESGIIENIAQTAAAGAGYYYVQNKIAQPLTYIGSISKLKIIKYPIIGNSIQTKVEILANALNVTIIKGSIYFNEELISECEMKIVIDNKNN